jgi:hypothetical protein
MVAMEASVIDWRRVAYRRTRGSVALAVADCAVMGVMALLRS